MYSRNFNVLLTGVFTKAVAGGIYAIAGMMLVLDLTGDPLYSGIAFFAITIPSCLSFLLAPFANYVPFKATLIGAEFLKAFLLLSVPFLYFNGLLNVVIVITVMCILSFITQFTEPIHSTLIPKVASKEHIVKANSLIAMIRESLDIVFIAIAGVC